MDMVNESQKAKLNNDKAMKQALKVADEYEKMDEEEMIRRAIEESQQQENEAKKIAAEEEEMIR